MRYLLLLAVLALNLAALTANRDTVFVDGNVFFVDADCYSRLTRVERVLAAPFTPIRHHEFENFPVGTDPHTTAPFDWLIAGLATALRPFSADPLNLAGAWISPLISLALLTFIWAATQHVPFRAAILVLLACSPMVIQAFQLGRPDHQSLTLALLTAGILAELHLRFHPTRRWIIAWGLLWGLALWVSLFEPLIILSLTLLTRLIPKAKSLPASSAPRRGKIRPRPLITAAVLATLILALGFLFDGWRVGPLDPEISEFFPRWATLLGELRSVPPMSTDWLTWFGWLLPAVIPLVIWGHLRPKPADSPSAAASEPAATFLTTHTTLLIVLSIATYGLTIWQVRWAPYFIAFTALLLPAALAAIHSRPAAWIAFGISLLPIAAAWEARLDPSAEAIAARDEQRTENLLLHQTATALISTDITPILAPWWLCPAIAYWSGQPCVGGSSHQSLPGIADTARFYTATSPAAALEILDRRQVRYVIAYEPTRLIPTSARILDVPPVQPATATRIFNHPNGLPPLQTVFANPFFRVLEVPLARERE